MSTRYVQIGVDKEHEHASFTGYMQNGVGMSREQIGELEENKRSLLKQAYLMKQENPHMSPVGLEYEMYASIMAEVRDITVRLQKSAEA